MVRTLLSVLVFLWAIPVLGQKSVPAWPANLDSIRYPIHHKVEMMPAMEIARLGLTVKTLDNAVVVWNWTEARKRFLPDTLQRGVVVVVDSTGNLVYKVDCWNRLVEFPSGASVLPVGGSATDSVTSDSTATPLVASTSTEGFASRFLEATKSLLRGLGWLLLALLGLAALAAAIMLLLYWLAELDNWMQRRRARRLSGNPPASVPAGSVAPTPVPTPSAVAPVAPITTPPASPSATTTEVPVATPATRRFISYFPGEDHRIRFSGVRNVRFEEEGGVTTIRFQNA